MIFTSITPPSPEILQPGDLWRTEKGAEMREWNGTAFQDLIPAAAPLNPVPAPATPAPPATAPGTIPAAESGQPEGVLTAEDAEALLAARGEAGGTYANGSPVEGEQQL